MGLLGMPQLLSPKFMELKFFFQSYLEISNDFSLLKSQDTIDYSVFENIDMKDAVTSNPKSNNSHSCGNTNNLSREKKPQKSNI